MRVEASDAGAGGGLGATDGRDPPDDMLENRPRDTTFVIPCARVEGVATLMLQPERYQAQRAGQSGARSSRTACSVPLTAMPLWFGWG